MAVSVRLSMLLQQCTGSKPVVQVQGGTVRACLDDLVMRLPRGERMIFDSLGRAMVLVRVNEDGPVLNDDRLDTAVEDGDELYLYLLCGGG